MLYQIQSRSKKEKLKFKGEQITNNIKLSNIETNNNYLSFLFIKY